MTIFRKEEQTSKNSINTKGQTRYKPRAKYRKKAKFKPELSGDTKPGTKSRTRTVGTKGETLEDTEETGSGEARQTHRRKRNNPSKQEGAQRLYADTHTNEGMKCRWCEAEKGQVRERSGKTLEGGKTEQV